MRTRLNLIIPCILVFASSFSWAGSVERGQFTSDIVDREPLDSIVKLDSQHNQIKYFTELRDLQGHIVTHQWVYNDEVMFEKLFNVEGNRWRVWSSKNLQPDWIGQWMVNTLDEDGKILRSQFFEYQ